ncbi:protein kinase domain-containing protein [Collimonas silvisoli]|uniref:protein kinase domain-containing protein n=1 Tax=Collimonas silvisoli TaxID=2825884 RepID=UPI001B8B8EE9|nr:protein kinase [Collimonas silvisoli]
MKKDDIEVCRQLAEIFVAKRGGGNIDLQLGDGGSAVVFLWDQTSAKQALKVYSPAFFTSDAAPAERFRLELQRRLINQHCISMVDTLAVDEENGTCFVTMEFFAGVELKRVIAAVPDEAIFPLIHQLVEAVQFLEKFDLVHRDIKPENILISRDFTQLKLLDLGVVRTISDDEDRVDGTDHGDKRPFIATAQYSSPEYLFRLEPPSPALWKALTIYQIGGVLHDLVRKRPLFEKAVAAENKYALAMAVMREAPDFSGVQSHNSRWAALAARCLTKDSQLRLQIVDWSDFSERTEPGKNKLKRLLSNRAANTARAELDQTQARLLRTARRESLERLVEELRKQLIAEFSPQLRISQLGRNENCICLHLKLTEVQLGLGLAVECSWESGIREKFASVQVAVRAALERDDIEFNGEYLPIGELIVDDQEQRQLLDTLVDAMSNMLVKHTELNDTGHLTDGMDLVALTKINLN